MGGTPSKKIEEKLETSSAFQSAVDASYEECMILSQHKVPGLQAYQLHDAAVRVYEKLSAVEDDDVVSKYKEKWLPQAPSQVEVDRTIKKEKLFEGGKQVVSLEDFRIFATTLFKDMGLATACNKLAVFVPAGSLGVLFAHVVVKRLPVVGPAYRAAGPVLPGLLLGSVVGIIMSKDLSWLRRITSLPILIKGVLTAEDASLAVQHGVAGIIVSNHGGRQLNYAPATIDVLEEVVEAVKGTVPVFLDGGIRRGTDVFKALARGAAGVFVGRPVVCGLAVDGEAGVRKVLQILKDEFELAMSLSGCRRVQDISRAHIRILSQSDSMSKL